MLLRLQNLRCLFCGIDWWWINWNYLLLLALRWCYRIIQNIMFKQSIFPGQSFIFHQFLISHNFFSFYIDWNHIVIVEIKHLLKMLGLWFLVCSCSIIIGIFWIVFVLLTNFIFGVFQISIFKSFSFLNNFILLVFNGFIFIFSSNLATNFILLKQGNFYFGEWILFKFRNFGLELFGGVFNIFWFSATHKLIVQICVILVKMLLDNCISLFSAKFKRIKIIIIIGFHFFNNHFLLLRINFFHFIFIFRGKINFILNLLFIDIIWVIISITTIIVDFVNALSFQLHFFSFDSWFCWGYHGFYFLWAMIFFLRP